MSEPTDTRDHGQDRLALEAARIRLPVLGDLRRPRLLVRLRPLRRSARRTTSRRAGSRRWCGSGTTSSRSTPRSSSTRRSGRRPATSAASATRSSTAARASSASAPTISTTGAEDVRQAAEQAARRDARLRPDRGAAVQPDVPDARRRDGGVGRRRLPAPGDGAGDLHQLQERRVRSRGASRPFGIAQVGKSFRNEITPGNFIFRTLEFEQMEMEFFVPPAEADEWYRYWVDERLELAQALRRPRQPSARAAARRRRALALLERDERHRVPLPDRLVGARGDREPRRLRPDAAHERVRDEARVVRGEHRRALRAVRDRAGARRQPLDADVHGRRLRRGGRRRARAHGAAPAPAARRP